MKALRNPPAKLITDSGDLFIYVVEVRTAPDFAAFGREIIVAILILFRGNDILRALATIGKIPFLFGKGINMITGRRMGKPIRVCTGVLGMGRFILRWLSGELSIIVSSITNRRRGRRFGIVMMALWRNRWLFFV